MTISQPRTARRSAKHQPPHLMALPSPPPASAITVEQALEAIEAVNSELSPPTYAALKAITDALVSLTIELRDARDHGDRLQRYIDGLEARIGTLLMWQPPAGDRARSLRQWTPEEDQRLRELAAQGLQINRVAMHLDRSYWSVWRRARQLGLSWSRDTDALVRGREVSRIHDRVAEAMRAFLARVAPSVR